MNVQIDNFIYLFLNRCMFFFSYYFILNVVDTHLTNKFNNYTFFFPKTHYI